MPEFNMPVAATPEPGGPSETQGRLYKPLPLETGKKFTNELFIPLFQPAKWELFNMSPDRAARLDLVSDNPLAPAPGEDDIWTFFFEIPVHDVKSFSRSDGSQGYAAVVCPKEFNNYLVKTLGRRPLFKNARCPFCEAQAAAWSEHNARWNEIERVHGFKRKSLNPDGYKDWVLRDPVLKESRDRARSLTANKRNVITPFDHSKTVGTRPREEGEQPALQVWFAAKKIADELITLYSERGSQLPFYSLDNPAGLQIIKLIKSTEECRVNNMRDTKYKVLSGEVFPYDDNWKTFLRDSVADPTDLLTILPYEEAATYVPGDTMNRPVVASVPVVAPNVQRAPVMQQLPVVPVAPVAPSFPELPTITVVSGAPVVPVVSSPVAPVVPTIPVAPVAPKMSKPPIPAAFKSPPAPPPMQQPKAVAAPTTTAPAVPAMALPDRSASAEEDDTSW